jgi:hypothetical protein
MSQKESSIRPRITGRTSLAFSAKRLLPSIKLLSLIFPLVFVVAWLNFDAEIRQQTGSIWEQAIRVESIQNT